MDVTPAQFLSYSITSATMVVGGVWALFRWANPLRRNMSTNAEVADGDISVEAISAEKKGIVVSVKGVWNNRGDFIIELKPAECLVSVYELQDNLTFGELANPNGQHWKQNPLAGRNRCELEPKTCSTFRAHFLLPPGRLYLIKWTMPSISGYRWSRDIVWKAPS